MGDNIIVPCELAGSADCAARKFSEELTDALAVNQGTTIKDETVNLQLGVGDKGVELSVDFEGNPTNMIYSRTPTRTCFVINCPNLSQCERR